ncbi:hypothetical protein TNCV_1703231 [Trichonephila clavipes]|nr:hypothetical protein TNCV_1703231 [Trichonephila clavipes]
MCRRRGSGAPRFKLEHTDRPTDQLTVRDPRHMTSKASCLQEQVDLCPPKPYSTDCLKHSYVYEYQRTSNRSTVDSSTQGAWRGVIVIVLGPSNGIVYCSRMNPVSICEGMTAVDGYGGDPENATNQPISSSFQIDPTCCIMGAPSTVFQQDNARQHVAGRINSLTGFDILLRPVNSPDLNSIEHLWNLIGSDLNQGSLAQAMTTVTLHVIVLHVLVTVTL